MIRVSVPELVAGRKDNVNIVSWLLSDYTMETEVEYLPADDGAGTRLDCLTGPEHRGSWALLRS